MCDNKWILTQRVKIYKLLQIKISAWPTAAKLNKNRSQNMAYKSECPGVDIVMLFCLLAGNCTVTVTNAGGTLWLTDILIQQRHL
jgi:hypothetical protein